MLFALRDRLRRIKVTAAAGLELKWSVVLVRCKEGKCYLSTFKGCVKRWSTTFQKCPNVLGCWKKTSLKTYFFPPLCFKLYTFFFFWKVLPLKSGQCLRAVFHNATKRNTRAKCATTGVSKKCAITCAHVQLYLFSYTCMRCGCKNICLDVAVDTSWHVFILERS